jgi:glucan 1,3-beta-glucosidase
MARLWPLFVVATGVVGQFWMEEIAHQGKSPYHPDAGYEIFRNVKDFGAVGDGCKKPSKARRVKSLTQTLL